MAAKRKIEIFDEITTEKEFEQVLKHENTLICAEIYCYFAGHCTALDRLFTTVKLDWSDGKIILVKVPADEIPAFERFRDHSEPVYMFILNRKVTKVFRGVNSLKLAEVAKKEIMFWKIKLEGTSISRPMYELDEPTPDEMGWLSRRSAEKAQETSTRAALTARRQAARKRHRAELMVPHVQTLNFVLFWPHCLHAHPALYERWDANNIIMVARELVQLTEASARDVLYAGDAPVNEASLQQLLAGDALAICFRLLDTDKHFVSLVRNILYEDLPDYDDSKPPEEQSPRVTAFELYKTISPTRQQVWQKRREERAKRRAAELEQRSRRLSEMQRLARQAIKDAIENKKKDRENKKMELLKSGNLEALDKFEQEPDDDEIDVGIPEELPDEYMEAPSTDEDEDEYLPPAGLVIPGFYSPPNDVAKANGLALLFPKSSRLSVKRLFIHSTYGNYLPLCYCTMLVESQSHHIIRQLGFSFLYFRGSTMTIHRGILSACDKGDFTSHVSRHKLIDIVQIVAEYVTPEPEFLPPHVLVMLEIAKRHKAVLALAKYTSAIIHMGVFRVKSPHHGVHIAYSVKQFDTLDISTNLEEIRLVFMLSIKSDIPLLQLMDLNPVHVSRDAAAGEDECAAMFPLNYGDHYDELDDFRND